MKFCILLLLTGMSWAQNVDTRSAPAFFQDRPQMSAAGVAMTLRAADLGQTLYHLGQTTWYEGRVYHGRETWLPTQNKAAISAAVVGSGLLTTYGQYRFYRAGHPRLAMLTQVISAGVSSVAIYHSYHSTYTVTQRK